MQRCHGIDVVIERHGSALVGIEIKVTSAPEPGDEFAAGVTLHTGPATYSLGERIVVDPVSTLWA